MADLPPFDPNAEFVAALPIRYRGVALYQGAKIDKSLAGRDEEGRNRVLRVLYENRRIRVADPEPAQPSDEEKQAGIIALTTEQTDRVAQLVADHTRPELDELAAGDPFNIPDPAKMATKEAVATAIVRAEAAAA